MLIFEFQDFLAYSMLAYTNESEEKMIELMMSRLGVKKSVFILRDFAVSTVYRLIFATITSIVLYDSIYARWLSFFVILTFAVLFTL